MAAETGINWCDSTFNPWIGCTRVSPACDDCYAARSTPTRTRNIEWGAGKPRQRTGAQNWNQPVKWNRQPFYHCPECGWRGDTPEMGRPGSVTEMLASCPDCDVLTIRDARRRVFCASLADWLDNEVPVEWLVDLLDLIRCTPNLDWLLLSKRVGNWVPRIAEAAHFVRERDAEKLRAGASPDLYAWLVSWGNGFPPTNVWIGATVVNQQEANRDVRKLLQVPARIRFLSIEPMLGPINLADIPVGGEHGNHEGAPIITGNALGRRAPIGAPRIHWVICGGESGPKARPMHPEWVRALWDQCAAAGVPFLMKQMGGHPNKRAALEDLPEDLRVREFPYGI